MDDLAGQTIEGLVERFQRKELSRGRFVATLARVGVSAAGVATLLSHADARAAAIESPSGKKKHHHNAKQHGAHVRHQGGATGGQAIAADSLHADPARLEHFQALLDDYAEDAVVDDPLFDRPLVGKQAIAERKLAEMQSMAGSRIEVLQRYAHGDQVVAEWVVRGQHAGTFLGYPATGRTLEVRGVTVVTRRDGKITRESLYYNADDVRRQLS